MIWHHLFLYICQRSFLDELQDLQRERKLDVESLAPPADRGMM